jgi:hypothetical protein
MRRFKLTDFTYDHNQLSADASDLNLPPGGAIREFEVQSHVTGRIVPFALQDTVRDAEGDIRYFIYESVQPYPTVFTATIFND